MSVQGLELPYRITNKQSTIDVQITSGVKQRSQSAAKTQVSRALKPSKQSTTNLMLSQKKGRLLKMKYVLRLRSTSHVSTK